MIGAFVLSLFLHTTVLQSTAAPAAPAAAETTATTGSGEPAPPPETMMQPQRPQPLQPQPTQGQPYPGGYPPPGYGYPPPGYPAPAYYYPAWAQYDAQSKSGIGAFALEFLLPGLGTAYTNRYGLSLLTVGGIVTGVVIMFNALDDSCGQYDDGQCNHRTNDDQLAFGVLMVVGARIFGLVAAPVTAGSHNDELARRLGLFNNVSAMAVPVAFNNGGGGMALRLAF